MLYDVIWCCMYLSSYRVFQRQTRNQWFPSALWAGALRYKFQAHSWWYPWYPQLLVRCPRYLSLFTLDYIGTGQNAVPQIWDSRDSLSDHKFQSIPTSLHVPHLIRTTEQHIRKLFIDYVIELFPSLVSFCLHATASPRLLPSTAGVASRRSPFRAPAAVIFG